MRIGRCGSAGRGIYAGDELIGGDRGAVAFDDFDQDIALILERDKQWKRT